jgi:hypothetical protein
VVVEGIYDGPVFEALIPKLCNLQVPVFVREAGGKGPLMSDFPKLVWTFQHVRRLGGPVARVLVVRDCNGEEATDVENAMRAKMADRHYPFQDGVRVFAVRRMTETWLMADVAAVNNVARGRGGRPVVAVPGPLEAIVAPKQRFRRLLSEAKLPHTAQVCGEIAAAIDLDVLRRECPSFARFEAVVG